MSDSTHGPVEDLGESSIPPNIPSLDTPRRTRKGSMEDEDWDDCLHLARLHQLHAQEESQLGQREFNKAHGDAESWYDEPDAQRFKLQYDSWRQWESIMNKHKGRLQKSLASGSESSVRLFTAPKVVPLIDGGMDSRGRIDRSNFAALMVKAYCPDPPAHRYRWDPVLQEWKDASIIRAAYLYPHRQFATMDKIFGEGAREELFQPVNGLFLHTKIEKALEKGLLAIVPDLDLEPAEPQLPLNDQQGRRDRLQEWEKQAIKDYKIIVLDKDNIEVKKIIFTVEDVGIRTLGELDGRKLVFKTDFRPGPRYVWWTYLNTILRTAWNPRARDSDVQHQEVQKVIRYWGGRGRYIKESQLLGFVEEIGHGVESLLTECAGSENARASPPTATAPTTADALEGDWQWC